jgi:nitroreductase
MDKPATTEYPVHDLIARRWSPRAFDSGRSVSPEAVGSLLEAARWAPSSMNEQPWRFVVARRERGEAFERLLDCLTPGNRRWAKDAAVLMLSVAKLRFARDDKLNRHALHDVGLAMGNLAAQATAMGLAVHQMGGFEIDEARQRYGIGEGYEPVAAVAIGYPAAPDQLPDELRQRELAPRTRKPLRDMIWPSE